MLTFVLVPGEDSVLEESSRGINDPHNCISVGSRSHCVNVHLKLTLQGFKKLSKMRSKDCTHRCSLPELDPIVVLRVFKDYSVYILTRVLGFLTQSLVQFGTADCCMEDRLIEIDDQGEHVPVQESPGGLLLQPSGLLQ